MNQVPRPAGGESGPPPADPDSMTWRDRLMALLMTRRITATRYLIVSVINVINHQLVLNVANSVWGWGGGASNAFAAMVAAVPGYLLSRYWVWEVRGSNSLRAEIIPFWTIALLGLVVSTVLAEVADRTFGAGIWVAVGSLVGYFFVWLLKFVILDRVFRRSAQGNRAAVAERDGEDDRAWVPPGR